jgi:hypothetical protein
MATLDHESDIASISDGEYLEGKNHESDVDDMKACMAGNKNVMAGPNHHHGAYENKLSVSSLLGDDLDPQIPLTKIGTAALSKHRDSEMPHCNESKLSYGKLDLVDI